MQWKKVDCMMKELKQDALLVSCRYNRRYLSGFSGDTGYLYISAGHRVLMTDSRYTTWAKNESNGVDVFEVNAEVSYIKKVGELIQLDQVHSIGFEDTKMLYSDVVKFQKELDVQWIPVGGALDFLRQVKTEEELEWLRISESMAIHAFQNVLCQLKTGMTEIETALLLEGEMRRLGAEGISFETIVASGKNSAMPHAVPTMKKLELGDFVTMDFGCIYKGYCSDMTRTVVMGKASEKQRGIYDTVLEAQETALKELRAGVTGQQVDHAARSVIEKAGYGSYFGHSLGHSVGLYIHEEPRLSPCETSVLKENMIETVEPGIYIPDFGGVRIEDMVIVKELGYENLTHAPKKLLEIQ